MEQISLFDFIEQPDVSSGIELGDVIEDCSLIGNVIPFGMLKEYVNKDVIYDSGFGSCKVVRIIKFFEDCEYVYRKHDDFVSSSGITYDEYVNEYIHDVCFPQDLKPHYLPEYKSSKVCFTDNARRSKSDLLCVAEHYCSNGRNDLFPNSYKCCFYTIHQ